MHLAVTPPYAPMEALSVEHVPLGREWQYEPKWDGFRCLAFKDGAEIELQSKSGQPLARYFPEIVEALAHVRARRFVLDGELVIPSGKSLSFDALLQRIHPAQSRVLALARATPARYVVFDLLVDERNRRVLEMPLAKRRERLETFFAKFLAAHEIFELTPKTTSASVARRWLARAGRKLDGVMAKRTDLAYATGTRDGMQKVKLMRSADCVVGGFRYAARKRCIGSLLLGLYDRAGLLHHVGFTSSMSADDKCAWTKRLEKLIAEPGFSGNAPGGPSRWSSERSSEWKPLAPKLVVEVQYDHASEQRFRHGTKFLRWRPDKRPRDCRMDQLARRG
jgi:ATP-dependent DNA ligase